MSDLQMGLVSLGVVLILVVVCFNWWQDRRVRQRMQEHFPEADQDPLLGTATAPERREPGFTSGASEAVEEDGDDPSEADAKCEAVIDIAFAHPVPSAALYEAIKHVHTAGGKPVRLFFERDGGGHRERLRADESYVSMQLAVLLANRSGPLTAIEWSQLWSAAQHLAERFEGALEGPEQNEVVHRAGELDALCSGLDAQVGLSVRLSGTRPVSEIMSVAKEAGFLHYDGQLAWLSESGHPRFQILFNGQSASKVQSAGVDRLDLLLDLPHSEPDQQAFSRMASVGRDLAARMNGVLVDDQGRPLKEGADQAIDDQLHQLYNNLEQAGFPAGTVRTSRLFS